MRKSAAVALFALCVLALANSAHAELKVGYVSVNRLLADAPQAEAAEQRLKKEFAPRKDSVDALQKELAQLGDELERDASVLTEVERRQRERDLRDRQRELRRQQDEFREDLNLRRNEEVGKLQQLVKEIVEKVGKEEQYDLIIYEGVAFASSKIDLTEKILERLRHDVDAAGKGGKTPAK